MDRILTAAELGGIRSGDFATHDERCDFRRGMGDAACFGGMVGCGETYFAAFAIALGFGDTAAGMVASLPLLAGGVLQLISPIAIGWVGGLRRWVVGGAVLQAIAFTPLAWAAWHGTLTLPMLLILASIYWAAGLATGPAWNTWMEDVVPKQQRSKFFARRSRLQQICTFSCLWIAGCALHYGTGHGTANKVFATMFAVAGLLRLWSAIFLHRTSPERDRPAAPKEIAATPTEIAATPKRSTASIGNPLTHASTRLLMYLVCMQGFIQISSPFFVPYMLKQLQFGYVTYVSLISLAFVTKVASTTMWAKIADRYGAKMVLWIGGVGLVPLASLWIVSTNVWWLAFIQMISGVAWAAYELGFFLMFFETLPAAKRTKLLTYYNFANTLALCCGALIGAYILNYAGCRCETYYCLFGISSLGRLLCLGMLVGVVMPAGKLRRIQTRILSVRPGGTLVTPVVASISRR